MIKERAGYDLDLSYRANDCFHVEYNASVKVPLIGKNVSKKIGADIHLIGINGSRVAARIDAGTMLNFLLDTFKSKIQGKLPPGVVKSIEGGRIELNLEKIDKVKPVLDSLILNNVIFSREGLYVDASIRGEKNRTAMV